MMMNSLEINEDMILEIMSHCSLTDIRKLRLLNKDCKKQSYDMCFLNRHLRRTNSLFGYFFQYNIRRTYVYHCRFVPGIEEAPPKTEISLEFIPRCDLRIEACDTRHGILLCVSDINIRFRKIERIPEYIVCKPTTKQYRTIPNPEYQCFSVATGLMVIQSNNPFRYKIVRVSEPTAEERRRNTKEGFYNLHCEVFDSDSFTWKQLNDLEFPNNGGFDTTKPNTMVSAYGFLHWLTIDYQVIRFCLRTETWSFFPVPVDIMGYFLTLVSYEGKLGVVCLDLAEEEDDLWVLENSFGNSWVSVKDTKISVGGVNRYVEPLWYPCNDVVSMAGFDLSGFRRKYKNQYFHMLTDAFYFRYRLATFECFPFYSNYERVDFE